MRFHNSSTKRLLTLIVTLTTIAGPALVGGAVAAASPPTRSATASTSTAFSEPSRANLIATETLTESLRVRLNKLLASHGYQTVSSNATKIGTTTSGSLITYSSSGNQLQEIRFSAEVGRSVAQGAVTQAAGGWLQGLARAFARAIVGCIGGVIGFDTVLAVLERRVSYWAFVRWLGGRVGWGLAVSCAAGAAAAVLGWD